MCELWNLSAKLFNLLKLLLNLWDLHNLSTHLLDLRNLSSTLFILLKSSTTMSALMLPDVNRSHLGATPEITETSTGVMFEGLWRWGAHIKISQRIAMEITETCTGVTFERVLQWDILSETNLRTPRGLQAPTHEISETCTVVSFERLLRFAQLAIKFHTIAHKLITHKL